MGRVFIFVYTVAGIAFWRDVWYIFDLLIISFKKFDGPNEKRLQMTFYCIMFFVSTFLKIWLAYCRDALLFYLFLFIFIYFYSFLPYTNCFTFFRNGLLLLWSTLKSTLQNQSSSFNLLDLWGWLLPVCQTYDLSYSSTYIVFHLIEANLSIALSSYFHLQLWKK